MAIRYRLRAIDGSDLGSFETNLSDWRVGSELIGSGNRHYRIVGIEDEADVFTVEPVSTGHGQRHD